MAFAEDTRAPFSHRTRFGGAALQAWRERCTAGGAQVEPETAWQVAECLADVLHLARSLGVDADRAMERAAHHFRREAAEV